LHTLIIVGTIYTNQQFTLKILCILTV
jgi:hypothetical protein